MQFKIDFDLIARSRSILSEKERSYWIVGGAGSGKTTICRALSARFDIPVYDLDAHIYGEYHDRFSSDHHPVNKAWSSAQNGLAWLLGMSWDQFNRFNQAALPEYLDLLCEDLQMNEYASGVLIDGGISNPALAARGFPPGQMVCLAYPGHSSAEIWTGTPERRSMQEMVMQLPDPQAAWQRFLEFDEQITATILSECRENQVRVCIRSETESEDELADRVTGILGLSQVSR